MLTFLISIVILVIAAGLIVYVNYTALKRKGETLDRDFLISLGSLAVVGIVLFSFFQITWTNKSKHDQQVFSNKIKLIKDEEARTIDNLKKTYAKEMALVEWKNKMFSSNSEMEKSLTKASKDYQLTQDETRMWRGLAENNTLEKLIPKDNTEQVLKEYQGRLKNSLQSVKSGQTLMNSDIRMMADNINAIRIIGKEYEKTLDVFKDLYNNMIASAQNGTVMEKPKQKKILFFSVKQKEYDQLLQQYYESQGNQKAVTEVTEKLKVAIDRAEAQFKAINQKFESNLSFLENNANGVSYNSDKLQKLIEAAISEVNVVSQTNTQNLSPIPVKNTTQNKD